MILKAQNRVVEGFRLLSELSISKCFFGEAYNISFTFPSPLGVIYFQICRKAIGKQPERGFPSPLGVIYFQISTSTVHAIVQYRMFPSPLGVIYFQIMQKVNFEELKKLFPSPLGVIYFQICRL